MKYICLIFFLFTTFSLNSQTIATFKMSLVLKNLESYQKFLIDLNNFKNNKFTELKIIEESLLKEKKEINDSKILLSQSEFEKKMIEFNQKSSNFQDKVNKLNSYLEINIRNNEQLILKEITEISKIIASENKIDLILFDDQFFLSSDIIDISKKIHEILNKRNINIKLSEYNE